MATIFTVSDILYVINTVNELLYMCSSPPCVDISHHVCDDKSNEYIKLSFLLKNGKSEIKISDRSALFYYMNYHGEAISSTSFTNERISDTNGSFHQAFKYIRSIDRQQANATQVINLAMDRVALGIADAN